MDFIKFLLLLLPIYHSYASSTHSTSCILVSATGILMSSISITLLTLWQDSYCGRLNSFNSTGFENHLHENLFGQHLVISSVANALKAHVMKSHPPKALVLSFHGWTGSGKNYVSKFIAEALYENGAKSKFVHWYIATRDFPHLSEAKKYRARIHEDIADYTKRCGQSLFIFDEMDKMGPGVIDAIKPYIDFYEEVDGIDYRRNIFLFLSNAGGSEITRVAFNFWMYGKDREEIDLRDIEPLVNQGAFNEVGGLQHSEIVEKNLIDMYVPFLPLEKKHVRKCIEHEFKKRDLTIKKQTVEKVMEQVVFYPPQFELFSVSGCKKVSHKVDVFGIE